MWNILKAKKKKRKKEISFFRALPLMGVEHFLFLAELFWVWSVTDWSAAQHLIRFIYLKAKSTESQDGDIQSLPPLPSVTLTWQCSSTSFILLGIPHNTGSNEKQGPSYIRMCPCQLPCCYPQGWGFPQRCSPWEAAPTLQGGGAGECWCSASFIEAHAVTLGGSGSMKGAQAWPPPFLLFLTSGSEFRVNPCWWEDALLCSQPGSP